jgi:hypothetical protein
LRPPIRPCSRWSLPRFTPPADPKAGRRHRHCGTGPRLTTDGRYPPPCAGELGLSSRPALDRSGAAARPSDRLADRPILRRRAGRASGRRLMGATGRDAIDGGTGQGVRDGVLCPRRVACTGLTGEIGLEHGPHAVHRGHSGNVTSVVASRVTGLTGGPSAGPPVRSAGVPPTRGLQRGRDRWPRSPVHQPPSSGRAARARRSTARNRSASGAPATRAG